MKCSSYFLLVIFICFNSYFLAAQDSINKKRFYPLIITSTIAYSAGIIGMNELWYKNSPRTNFHFFNDFNEWKQVDKLGHFTTTAIESIYYFELLKWSGISPSKAGALGPLVGVLLQTPIEILDGFSPRYGASLADAGSNILGASFVFGQLCFWKKIKVYPKFSFHPTEYSKERPNVLGSNLTESILKDYNGQTYWLSINPSDFVLSIPKYLRWLSLSIGYGADKMIFANHSENKLIGLAPYRQYYLGLDIDFTKIPTQKKFFKILFFNLNFIHIPLPAFEFSNKRISFHPIYF